VQESIILVITPLTERLYFKLHVTSLVIFYRFHRNYKFLTVLFQEMTWGEKQISLFYNAGVKQKASLAK
jgi:hypothetical protein